eukprot:3960634-Pyramimonas_sp.AAC.1
MWPEPPSSSIRPEGGSFAQFSPNAALPRLVGPERHARRGGRGVAWGRLIAGGARSCAHCTLFGRQNVVQ